jgi:uncharacterized RDD family membrane protein YckC/DNA-directed RNA polymerase subunit RPC12/RpoP
MNWHYVQSGEAKGPVSDQEFQNLIAQGVIGPSTLVWRDGMAEWVPLSQAGVQAAPAAAPPQILPGGLAPSGAAVCSQCGRAFPPGEVIQVGSLNVCAECKPAFLQRVREGGELGPGQLKYAGFWIRFAAKIIDGLIMGVVNGLLGFALGLVFTTTVKARPGEVFFPPVMLASFGFGVILAASYSTFFLGRFGATPGKMACKLKVVTPEGRPVSYATGFGRYFGEMVSALICYIGFMMAGWDSEKRALHDRICNTRVIYAQP